MTNTTTTPEVKPGQIWKDNDKRLPVERFLRVVRIEPDTPYPNGHWSKFAKSYAICSRVFQSADGAWNVCPRSKRARIAVERFRPTASGYVLVDAGK